MIKADVWKDKAFSGLRFGVGLYGTAHLHRLGRNEIEFA